MNEADDRSEKVLTPVRRWIGAKLCKRAKLTPRVSARLIGGQGGNALVEMALVMAVLMTVFTGAASFSMGLYRMQQLGNVTSTAAQQLGAMAGNLSDPCAQVVTTVTTALPNWTAANLSYQVVITDQSGVTHSYPSSGYTAGSSFSCSSGASANMGANEPVTVTINYQYNWFPILRYSATLGNLSASETALMD